ncbi:hypothetical protein SAMN04488004_12041 [Loktanella salsilacus]|uniref:Uncharacterized protein n=1 Tax=Loktanella salsilacus TaxID=195913 RepID=A0A1I4HX49_9RHOB|nr:hypothetical protein SAMN04488004_12041 [Loktanella salsilacus]
MNIRPIETEAELQPIRHMAGHIYGTNTGRLFLEYMTTGPGDRVEGRLRLNDDAVGLLQFDVVGTFNGQYLNFDGQLKQNKAEGGIEEENVVVSLQANLQLNDGGAFGGRWETSVGNAGTMQLFPHDHIEKTSLPYEQALGLRLHIHNRQLGVVRLAFGDIKRLIEFLQEKLPGSTVLVNHSALGNSEKEAGQTTLAPEFLASAAELGILQQMRLDARSQGPDGLDRTVTIELGRYEKNEIRVAGGDEVWVTGVLEAVNAQLADKQSKVATLYRKHGSLLNTGVFLALLIWLPGVPGVVNRLYVTVIAMIAMLVLLRVHQTTVPLAQIRLAQAQRSFLDEVWPGLATGVLTALALGVATTLLAFVDADSLFSGLSKLLRLISGSEGETGGAVE